MHAIPSFERIFCILPLARDCCFDECCGEVGFDDIKLVPPVLFLA
jgi:hypothetical protein